MRGGAVVEERGKLSRTEEKLSCVTVMAADSWPALFHRSPRCLLGGPSA